MREEIGNTLRQAKEDFDVARTNIGIKKYFVSAFLSQQAAEKALKALCMYKFRTFIRTHDLTKLCEKLCSPTEVTRAAKRFTPEYVVTRYVNAANSMPADIYDEEIANNQLNNANIILKWVESLMK